ncbi:hypothetical protein KOXY103107_08820 [Komagataeibacter xylinus]
MCRARATRWELNITHISCLSPVACRLSPVACRLSPVACRLSPVTVWSDGHQYTYNDLGSDAHACMGADGCLIEERGAIKLSKDEFY